MKKLSITSILAIYAKRIGFKKETPRGKPMFRIHPKIRSRQARRLFGK